MLRTAITVLLTLVLDPTAAAQSAVVALDGGAEIWTVDETTGAKSLALEGAAFLPLELAGTPRIDRWRDDRPRLVEGSGPPHVRLPGGGALYRVSTGADTALLSVADDGTPTLVGSGVARPVAADPDGARVLVASGADVVLLDLSGAPAATLAVGVGAVASSLTLSASRAFFVAGGLLWRADLDAAPVAAPVPLVLDPGESVLPEVRLAPDGENAAVVTTQPAGRRVHVVDAAGAATCVTPDPGPWDPIALDAPGGPRVALAPDGSAIAFRGTQVASELFVAWLAAPAPTVQLTANGNYVDTMDGVGVLGFVDSQRVLFLVGETDVENAFDRTDVFLATFEAGGGLTLDNLTGTSGVATPPFTPGTIEIAELAFDPLAERVILTVDPLDGDAGLSAVRADGTPGLTPLLTALAATPRVEPVGDALLIAARRDLGLGGIVTDLHLLHPLDDPLGLQPLGTAPAGVLVDRLVGSSSGAEAAFVVSASPSLALAVRVGVATGALSLALPQPFAITPALAFSPSDRLVLGVGPGDGSFLYLSLTGPSAGEKLPLGVAPGVPLAR